MRQVQMSIAYGTHYYQHPYSCLLWGCLVQNTYLEGLNGSCSAKNKIKTTSLERQLVHLLILPIFLSLNFKSFVYSFQFYEIQVPTQFVIFEGGNLKIVCRIYLETLEFRQTIKSEPLHFFLPLWKTILQWDRKRNW